jgi:uncharacterized protein
VVTVKVAVTGATGLLGTHLVAALGARGDGVVALSRRSTEVAGVATTRWEPAREPLPAAARDGVDAIVNLAGEPLAVGRWGAARRARILDSRVAATRGVAAALGDGGPRFLVSASAVGFYGESETPVDEDAPPGDDFLADVCVRWEQEATSAGDRARVVLARMGVVLSGDGGALPPLLRVARLGALGSMGSGRQWVPWIHIDDEIAALLHCLDHEGVVGPVNLVAPNPVRQAELARAIRRAVHRPPTLPAPSFLVRAALGESASLVLSGQKVVPSVLAASGFCFEHASLDEALHALLRS